MPLLTFDSPEEAEAYRQAHAVPVPVEYADPGMGEPCWVLWWGEEAHAVPAEAGGSEVTPQG